MTRFVRDWGYFAIFALMLVLQIIGIVFACAGALVVVLWLFDRLA